MQSAPILYSYLPTIRQAGDVLQIALPAAAFLSTIYHRDLPGFCALLKSTIVTSAISHSVKFFADYTELGYRPNGKHGSFPSAHTSSAFSAASFVDNYYDSSVANTIIYPLACFTACSRVIANQHHVRDVVAGAMIGCYISYYFVNQYQQAATL